MRQPRKKCGETSKYIEALSGGVLIVDEFDVEHGFEIWSCLSSLCLVILYKGSLNIEMDDHTFLVNRERAIDYLNSLEKMDYYFHWKINSKENLKGLFDFFFGYIWWIWWRVCFENDRLCKWLFSKFGSWAPNQSQNCLSKIISLSLHAQHVSINYCHSSILYVRDHKYSVTSIGIIWYLVIIFEEEIELKIDKNMSTHTHTHTHALPFPLVYICMCFFCLRANIFILISFF